MVSNLLSFAKLKPIDLIMMKQLLITLSLFILPILLSAEKRIIEGHITDQECNAIPGAKISTDYGEVFSNPNGDFYIAVNENTESFTVALTGYLTQVILLEEEISEFNIVMRESNNMADYTSQLNMKSPESYTEKKSEFYLSVGFNGFAMDFSEFEHLLGSDNMDLIDGAAITLDLGIGGSVNRHYYKFSLGLMALEDSIGGIEYNTTKYKIDYGYNIIDRTHFALRPLASVNWYRFRLLNYDPENEIPLTDYLSERDLDLRINQITGNLGGEMEFKFNENNGNYYSLILYGAYHFKINQNPWIYSRRNKLKTSANYEVSPLAIGATFSFNFGN